MGYKVLENWDHEYPVRCIIMDPGGKKFTDDTVMVAPILSLPHIGEFGTARSVGEVTLNFGDGPCVIRDIIIDLDGGEQLHGTQCWWLPIED